MLEMSDQWSTAWKFTSLLLRPTLLWISLQATPMAKRVSNHAIKAAAAAAARLSVRQIRKWWVPAKVEAIPTMLAINTKMRKICVAELPENTKNQEVLVDAKTEPHCTVESTNTISEKKQENKELPVFTSPCRTYRH
jgi:hypothetical protein